MYPEAIQEQVLLTHGDLYRRHPEGFPALDVRDGKIRVDSLLNAPFGYGFAMDASVFVPREQWSYQSLRG
ncbi:hypothetical protein SDC9_199791 [bioreactor metagenome]|uniref:Uncharacterized protein n=1 Tax=bioreactor metagenome TaxID=1076179 RepID=A0A645ILJ5_9ZZZZ